MKTATTSEEPFHATGDATSVDIKPELRKLVADTAPPLISFVVINWNYGRYIGATIESIRGQNYPSLECLIVDNASTDDSLDVIRNHTVGDDRFRLLNFSENLGQLGAILRLGNRPLGEFICFVDSDDVLLPDFAAAHIYTHLATSSSIALTSSNVLEISQTGGVLSGRLNGFRSNIPRNATGIEIQTSPKLFGLSEKAAQLVLRQMTLVPKTMLVRGWFWAPGTANVFRRSAIEQVLPIAPDQVPTDYAGDALLNELCHVAGGTALIDLPLSLYRIHDSNDGADGSSMGYRNQKPAAGLRSVRQRQHMCAWLILGREKTMSWLSADRFWPVLDHILRYAPDLSSAFKHPAIGKAVAEKLQCLATEFGRWETIRQIRARMHFWDLLRLCRSVTPRELRWALPLLVAIEASGAVRRRLPRNPAHS